MNDTTFDHSREELQRTLESAGAVFRGKSCRCIFHDDRTASAGLYERDGHWRFSCHACGAGGDLADVRKLLGERPAIYGGPVHPGNGNGHTGRKIVATYSYVGVNGEVLYEKVRYEPKSFVIRRPDGKGGHAWGIGDAPRVLYRLPELLAAPPDSIVFIVEGEKDADNLCAVGLFGTCNFDGAAGVGQRSKWRPEYDQHFAGRIVCIVADKDAPGRAHAQAVAAGVFPVAREVKVVEVPGAACKDASDYLSAGGTAEGLLALFDTAPPWKPPVAMPGRGVSGYGVMGIAYEPFPVTVLPPALADMVSEGAAALGCDAAQIALPMLAACSAGVGNSRRIVLKSSWIEPAAVWAVPVLPSGALKSPALDLALDPIRKAQAKAIAEWRQEMEEYQARHDAWEDQKKNLRGPEPMPPVCARIVVSDTTVEALADRLQSAPRGLLCERDELSGWLNGFNQYKAKGGADVAHWLTMHRAGPLLMDRKTGDQKIIHTPRAFVALTGTIQPGVLRRALTPEYMEAGLAARLLVAMPPVKRRTWSEATVRESVRKRYAGTLAALMALPMGGAPLDPEPVDLLMTADAKRLWVEFYDAHNAAAQAGEGGDLAAAWSKLEGYAARLALILHCVRAVGGEADPAAVDAVSMAAGIALARWFAREAERVYAMLGGDTETDEGVDLQTLIAERGGRITARELRNAKGKYHAPGAARDALCRLVEAGHGRWVPLPTSERGGRPVEVFESISTPSPKPAIPASLIPETPNGAIVAGGIVDGDGGDGGVSRMAVVSHRVQNLPTVRGRGKK